MDWRSIAGLVAPHAPKIGAVLGTAFGGPIGATIGGIAGTAIAAAFGVEATPEAVKTAIEKDPQGAVEKLRILEATEGERIRAAALIEVERIKGDAEQSKTINETIRAEVGVVSWWHWRHLLGYVTLLFALVLVAGFARVMFLGGDVAGFTALVAQASIIFGILAALNGYVASDTTNRINTVVTGEHSAGGVMNTFRNILVKTK